MKPSSKLKEGFYKFTNLGLNSVVAIWPLPFEFPDEDFLEIAEGTQ